MEETAFLIRVSHSSQCGSSGPWLCPSQVKHAFLPRTYLLTTTRTAFVESPGPPELLQWHYRQCRQVLCCSLLRQPLMPAVAFWCGEKTFWLLEHLIFIALFQMQSDTRTTTAENQAEATAVPTRLVEWWRGEWRTLVLRIGISLYKQQCKTTWNRTWKVITSFIAARGS